MKDTNHSDDWRSLCELASKESDPQKLLDLISKINRALEECRQPKQPEQVSLRVMPAATQASQGTDFDCYSFPGQSALAIEYDC